jgi:hypothetical protein
MENGFDKDPQFEIIYMPPGAEEKENEWPETGAPDGWDDAGQSDGPRTDRQGKGQNN